MGIHETIATPSFDGLARYVRINKFAELTGWTAKAVYHKMYSGAWTEGRVWRRAPDGNPVIDLAGYRQWIERDHG